MNYAAATEEYAAILEESPEELAHRFLKSHLKTERKLALPIQLLDLINEPRIG